MSLQRAPRGYSVEDQDRLRRDLEEAERKNRKLGQDVEAAGAERFILSSPDGTRWALSADNAGVLTLVLA